MAAHAKPEANDDALGDVERELTILARSLEAIQRARAYPLERAHYILLGLLLRDGPMAIGALARGLQLDESTATRQVGAMEALELVTKATGPKDRRSMLVAPTAIGRRQHAAMRRERLARLGAMLETWSEDERADAARVLARFTQALASRPRE